MKAHMRRISSQWTFVNKKIWPVFWLGLLALLVLDASPQIRAGKVNLVFILAPPALALFGYFVLRKFVLDLADEVWDAGEALIVRNGGEEDRIALADIMGVSCSMFQNPPRVTLALRQPCRFGAEVAFMPPVRFLPFARSPVIDDLIQRIDQARHAGPH